MGLLPAIACYLINAHERFGGWTDDGLWRWWKVDAPTLGYPIYGPFSLHYLPFGLFTAFFLGPRFALAFPWIFPMPLGQSLLTTSPALLVALRADVSRETLLLWLAAIFSMAAALCVYSNGVGQVGCRYWLMAYPFLVLLMSKSPMDGFAKILICASIALMSYQMWYVRTFPF